MKTEHEEQREFVMWVRQNTPHLIYAIPNGGSRSGREGMRLKCEGVLAGMPDLHVPGLRLWVEMKRRKGKARASQLAIHEKLRAVGDVVEVCDSCEGAIEVVTREMAKRGQAPMKRIMREMEE